MRFFSKEVELVVHPKKQNGNNTIKIKSLNCYGAIREKIY